MNRTERPVYANNELLQCCTQLIQINKESKEIPATIYTATAEPLITKIWELTMGSLAIEKPLGFSKYNKEIQTMWNQLKQNPKTTDLSLIQSQINSYCTKIKDQVPEIIPDSEPLNPLYISTSSQSDSHQNNPTNSKSSKMSLIATPSFPETLPSSSNLIAPMRRNSPTPVTVLSSVPIPVSSPLTKSEFPTAPTNQTDSFKIDPEVYQFYPPEDRLIFIQTAFQTRRKDLLQDLGNFEADPSNLGKIFELIQNLENPPTLPPAKRHQSEEKQNSQSASSRQTSTRSYSLASTSFNDVLREVNQSGKFHLIGHWIQHQAIVQEENFYSCLDYPRTIGTVCAAWDRMSSSRSSAIKLFEQAISQSKEAAIDTILNSSISEMFSTTHLDRLLKKTKDSKTTEKITKLLNQKRENKTDKIIEIAKFLHDQEIDLLEKAQDICENNLIEIFTNNIDSLLFQIAERMFDDRSEPSEMQAILAKILYEIIAQSDWQKVEAFIKHDLFTFLPPDARVKSIESMRYKKAPDDIVAQYVQNHVDSLDAESAD